MAEEVKKVQETTATKQAASAASSTGAAPTTGAAAARASGQTSTTSTETTAASASGSQQAATSTARTGELDPGKSTVKGTTDYFDGKSVITDADTVIDIAKIMDECKASNMKPETLAAELKERGYDVEVVKMGNRKAVQFKNGDYFVDSDGDGNLGTKDQNFQNALTSVEQKFGVNLSDLKSSKYTQIHKGGGKKVDGLDGVLGLDGLNGLNGLDGQKAQLDRIFAQLDVEMAAKGYDGAEKSEDLWKNRQLSPVLQQLEIPEPALPQPSSLGLAGGLLAGLNLFGAAYNVAQQREAAL